MRRASCLPTTLLGLGLALTACKKDHDTTPTDCSETVVGTWQLTQRQCLCAPAPTPDERVTFDGLGNFAFSRNGQIVSSGTYTLTTTAPNALCNANQPNVNFAYSTGTPTSHNASASYALANCELVLDFGSCLDAPRDTYARQ